MLWWRWDDAGLDDRTDLERTSCLCILHLENCTICSGLMINPEQMVQFCRSTFCRPSLLYKYSFQLEMGVQALNELVANTEHFSIFENNIKAFERLVKQGVWYDPQLAIFYDWEDTGRYFV